MSDRFRIVSAGDALLIVECGEPALSRGETAAAVARALEAATLPDVLDIVPTTSTVGIYFDPVHTDPGHLAPLIAGMIDELPEVVSREPRVVDVPVCYGGAYGPDLAALARFANLPEAEVIAIHSGTTYRVAMLGFAPGFAYMDVVDSRIAMPRRDEPRAQVPAGSVAIGGAQTSIYPFHGPGGWRLIGRTPMSPCDFRRADPFLFSAGDCVRFVPIDASAFEQFTARSQTALL